MKTFPSLVHFTYLSLLSLSLSLSLSPRTSMWMSVSLARRTFYYDAFPITRVVFVPILIHGTFDFVLIASINSK